MQGEELLHERVHKLRSGCVGEELLHERVHKLRAGFAGGGINP